MNTPLAPLQVSTNNTTNTLMDIANASNNDNHDSSSNSTSKHEDPCEPVTNHDNAEKQRAASNNHSMSPTASNPSDLSSSKASSDSGNSSGESGGNSKGSEDDHTSDDNRGFHKGHGHQQDQNSATSPHRRTEDSNENSDAS